MWEDACGRVVMLSNDTNVCTSVSEPREGLELKWRMSPSCEPYPKIADAASNPFRHVRLSVIILRAKS